MPTDEEVNKRQAEIAKLRDQAAAARLKAEDAQREQANAVTMAALDVEEERLKAEIEQYEAQADKKAVKKAVDAQVAQVRGATGVDPKKIEKEYGQGVTVQHQADGSVLVLAVQTDAAPELPTPVTENTPPEPTPDSLADTTAPKE